MHPGLDHVKKAIIDGFFILLPFLLIFLVLEETLILINQLLAPLTEHVPGKKVLGISVSSWLAFFLILISFMLIGFVSRTRTGKSIGSWFDKNILNYLPGYQLLNTISRQFSGKGEDILLSPALFRSDMGTWMYAFILDEFDNDMYSLFVPMAPTPMMGTVQYVDSSRVKKMDLPPTVVIDNLMTWGIDSKSVLNPQDYIGEIK